MTDHSLWIGFGASARTPTRSNARAYGALVLAACVALAGCVPGQNASLVRANQTDSSYVRVVPITPQLITTERAATPPVAVPAALASYKPGPYQIGPGDTLYITVWNHPELTSPAGAQKEAAANGRVVQANGTVFYPYLGPVHAAGDTVDQLRQALTSALSQYFKNPQVDVSVITYASQHVLLEGAFTTTGPQPITAVPLTLGAAMGKAVVDDPHANLADVMLTRAGQTWHLDVDALDRSGAANHIYLKAGDRIYLPYNSHQAVYVLGEVNGPRVVRFSSADITLTEAIGAAGGLNQVTSKGKIYVIRGTTRAGQPKATVYELNAKSAVSFALADGFDVKPGDVVFASSAGITRWNRFLSQLLPITSALSSTAAAGYYVQRGSTP
ncbi:MAG TPA: polysaccharide biosynthesis/export family protein [Rhodanobacteraceae bacterium]|nr:polysaccharide biosynthesis/export family protein [Rhodanobacteraceae bacterium]